MNTYAIRRKNAWRSPEELEQVAARSKTVADSDFPDDIRWIRSYVIAEEDGRSEASASTRPRPAGDPRARQSCVGMPADEILDVADTVVIRPTPQRSRLRHDIQGAAGV